MELALAINESHETEHLAAIDASLASDLELHIIESFLKYLHSSYLGLKNASKFSYFMVVAGEKAATYSGIYHVVSFFFHYFQCYGGPTFQKLDKTLSDKVIQIIVNVLLATTAQRQNSTVAEHETTMDIVQRVEILLRGDLSALLLDYNGEHAAPTVMDLKDMVPMSEFESMKANSEKEISNLQSQVATLNRKAEIFAKEKERLEQQLTDVHSYQETERGRKFQEMEEALARAKLEASQKSHDLSKLQLVVDKIKRKRRHKASKSTSNQSETASLLPEEVS